MTEQDTASADGTQAAKYLTFSLGSGAYGIPILHVREIIAVQPITPLPRMPAAVNGVINLRGKIIPVVDLRVRLGLEAAEFDRATCIIVLDIEAPDQGAVNVGCVVDAVREVSSIATGEIQLPPSVGTKVSADYIQGLAKAKGADYVTTLLNMGVILADFVAEQALVEAEV